MVRTSKRLYIEPDDDIPDKSVIKEIGLQILKEPTLKKVTVGDESYYCNCVVDSWYMIMGVQRHCLFGLDLEGLRSE